MKIIPPEPASYSPHVILTAEDINKVINFYAHAKKVMTPIINNGKYPQNVRLSLKKFLSDLGRIMERDNFIPNCYLPVFWSELEILNGILEG